MCAHKQSLIENNSFIEFMQTLVDASRLEGAALGITKLVIDKGIESLSEKQKYVFQTQVIDGYTVNKRMRYGHTILWSEMHLALDSGMCNFGEHMHQKIREEQPCLMKALNIYLRLTIR